MGCPIRRSRDQRLLASPPGLSQRATSFIASQCQGIHQMPLIRLILFAITAAHSDKPQQGANLNKANHAVRSITATPLKTLHYPVRHVRLPQASIARDPNKTHGPHRNPRFTHIHNDKQPKRRHRRLSNPPLQPWAFPSNPLTRTPNLVEVNGIEPMTSCLQSRRSTN